jgi:hypothetical protein
MLGAFINNFKVTGASYSGGSFDWLTPFSLFTGAGLVVAYALLGTTWLILKTEGELQRRLKALARPTVLALFAVIVVVSVWTPLAHPSIATRWFSFPDLVIFSPVPLLVFATTWLIDSRASKGNARITVLACASGALSWVHWPCDKRLAECCPADDFDPAGCWTTRKHGLYSGRSSFRHPVRSRLHRDVVLCVPREGEARRRLSLMGTDLPEGFLTRLRQVFWFVLTWTSGVSILAAVAIILRALMSLAGLTL